MGPLPNGLYKWLINGGDWDDSSWLITKVSAATATTKNKNKEQRINMGLVVAFGLVVWVKTYNLRC